MNRFNKVDKAIKTEMEKPYIYGKSDCFFLGLRVVDAVRGTDLAKEYSNLYDSLETANKSLRDKGFRSLVSFFKTHLKPKPVTKCILGDIAIVKFDRAQHVAIHTGNGFVSRTSNGFKMFSFDEVQKAFEV